MEPVLIPTAIMDPILVVGHQLASSSSLRYLLSLHPRWTVCAVVANGKEAIEKILEQHPYAVVFNLSEPVKDALECVHEIHRIGPAIKAVFVRVPGGQNLP